MIGKRRGINSGRWTADSLLLADGKFEVLGQAEGGRGRERGEEGGRWRKWEEEGERGWE